MTRTEALRRLLFSHGRACARLVRQMHDDESHIRAALSDDATMAGALRVAARLSADEVERLLRPLITSDGPGPSPTPGDIETCRMVAAYA